MKTLWWQTVGTGNCHLVLLHGWGLNAEIWHCIREELASHFTLHLVDLPGFGRSRGYGALSLDEMAQQVLDAAPQNAVWLGWSLGGLVASQIALSHPDRVKALVTVASSPCFSAQEEWPGIKPDVLAGFQQQLSEDFQRTVEPARTAGSSDGAAPAYLRLSRRDCAAQSGSAAGFALAGQRIADYCQGRACPVYLSSDGILFSAHCVKSTFRLIIFYPSWKK